MRKFLPLVLMILCVQSFGQSEKMPEPVNTEFLNQKFWSVLGKPTEGIRGFSLFSRNLQPKTDSLFELWVKIVPNNAAAFNKRFYLPRSASYVIQYATVDCGKRVVLLERTAVYSSENTTLDARSSDIFKNESRTRVRPGSISESVFQYICLKLE